MDLSGYQENRWKPVFSGPSKIWGLDANWGQSISCFFRIPLDHICAIAADLRLSGHEFLYLHCPHILV